MTRARITGWLLCSLVGMLGACGGDDNHGMDGGTAGTTGGTGGSVGGGGGGGTGGSVGGSTGGQAGRGGGGGSIVGGTGGGGTGGSAGRGGTGGGGTGGGGTGGSAGRGGTGGGGTGGGGTGGSAGRGGTSGGTGGGGTGGSVVPPVLTATVVDRRQVSVQLTWPAPATSTGGAVSGYDVRVAKVVITAANFDDTTVTKAITFAGTPMAPGQTETLLVSGLNIEDPYYFAVVGKDAGGTRITTTMLFTATATQTQFMTTVLSGSGTDALGQDIDGTGDYGRASDLNFVADGYSDLLVGSNNGNKVFVYFGSASGYSPTPSITITGTLGFGNSVINAGDLDGDGLADIAIASPNDGSGKIYVFSRKSPPASWGTTTGWPSTLTQAQANYVLTVDATFGGGAGSIQPGGLARLGNFDGLGADDIAVGLLLHTTDAGSLLIIKGSSTFASATIPGTSTYEIDGTAGSFFGWPVVGIGQFYSGGNTLISSAAPSNVYAFRGQAPSGILALTAATDSAIGPTVDGYGYSLGFIGEMGGPVSVTVSAYMAPTPYVDIHLGTTASGVFQGAAGAAPAAAVRLTDSASSNSFGILNLGSSVKGTTQVVSLTGGDNVPDLVVGGHAETGSPVYVVNGAAISKMTGSINVSAAQPAVIGPIIKVANRLPASWGGFAGATIIPHSDNDSHGDFAIGEFAPNKPGRVVVFH